MKVGKYCKWLGSTIVRIARLPSWKKKYVMLVALFAFHNFYWTMRLLTFDSDMGFEQYQRLTREMAEGAGGR